MNTPAGKDGVPEDVFHEIYKGEPPWEVGRPQKEILRLAGDGKITGTVLDLGCGTGENSLFLAKQGLTVVGIDPVKEAVRRAEAKLRERKLSHVTFRVENALALPFDSEFDTVIDTGVFHVFSDRDRPVYVKNVTRSLRPGGRLIVVCFNENEPGGGPRRVTRAELHSTFDEAFRIESIETGAYETAEGDGEAWVMQAVTRRV